MMNDLIDTSLELAAENAGDITFAIYEQYYLLCPDAKPLIETVDLGVQGKMIQEVMRLIMLSDYVGEANYLKFEVKCHKTSFSVEGHMYSLLLQAVYLVVKDAIKDVVDWDQTFEEAWQQRINDLLGEIETVEAAI